MSSCIQGCQMIYIQTQNLNLGKFWRALHRLENVYVFYVNWEYLSDNWYILSSFGKLFPVLVSCIDKNLATQVVTSFIQK
jgi:hypothetical protein